MIACEICGRHDTLTPALIERVKLNVCRNCSSHGNILGKTKQNNENKIQNNKSEQIEIIRNDCPQIVKTAREKLGITQKELAEKIKEKESIIPKIESGSHKPDLNIAKKLEKFLSIKIISISEEATLENKNGSNDTLTIGDLVKIKK